MGNVSVGKSRKGWIKSAVRRPGALHKQLGVPVGSRIPRGKLEEAARSDSPTLAGRARFVLALEDLLAGVRGADRPLDPEAGALAERAVRRAEMASSRGAKARAEAAVQRAKQARGGK